MTNTGAVKWFDVTKGYGFISGDDDVYYFVHVSAIRYGDKELKAGDRVEFEVLQDKRGPKAGSVRAEVRPTDGTAG
jgi:CspA family cold shock protein